MRFTPKTEEQLIRLLEPGIWDYEVAKAEEQTSKKGNQMLHLVLKCWDQHGRSGLIHDYILDSDDFDWKQRHFCYSNGLDTQYEKGVVESHMCDKRSGKCKGGIEKDKSGQYPDKNKIVDYIVSDEKNKEMTAAKTNGLVDDEIPF